MGLTLNYAWPYPDGGDPVDVVADMAALADAADATVKANDVAAKAAVAPSVVSGGALASVSTAGESTYAAWTGGATFTVPAGQGGTYEIWTGPTAVEVATAILTGGRFAIAKNGAVIGNYARFVGSQVFDAATLTCYELVALAAGDVISLRYSTNNKPVSFGAHSLYYRRIGA